jgi:hypothetical protein
MDTPASDLTQASTTLADPNESGRPGSRVALAISLSIVGLMLVVLLLVVVAPSAGAAGGCGGG